jgi:hypothetical protein
MVKSNEESDNTRSKKLHTIPTLSLRLPIDIPLPLPPSHFFPSIAKRICVKLSLNEQYTYRHPAHNPAICEYAAQEGKTSLEER